MILSAERLEEDGGVDVDHVGAGVCEDVDEGGHAVVVEPAEDAPFGAARGGILLRLLRRARPQRDHQELAVVHGVDREEVRVLHEYLLRHLRHRRHRLVYYYCMYSNMLQV